MYEPRSTIHIFMLDRCSAKVNARIVDGDRTGSDAAWRRPSYISAGGDIGASQRTAWLDIKG